MLENNDLEKHDVSECTTCSNCTCKHVTTTNAEYPQWVLGVEYESENDEKDNS